MQPIEPKIRAPRKTHGGKAYECRDIVRTFRPHDIFLEDYGGGANVLLNKPRCSLEIYNDADWLNANIFGCLRDYAAKLAKLLKGTPYAEKSFEIAAGVVKKFDVFRSSSMDSVTGWQVDVAAAAIIASRMSRGGLGKSFAWSDRKRGGQPGDKNSWMTFIASDLPRAAERMKDVQVLCQDAMPLFNLFAEMSKGKRGLVYRDPPYMPKTKTIKKAYGVYEMTETQHAYMLAQSVAANFDVAISGYDSKLYRTFLEDECAGRVRPWRRFEKEVSNRSGQNKIKNRRTEVLWLSYASDVEPFQTRRIRHDVAPAPI